MRLRDKIKDGEARLETYKKIIGDIQGWNATGRDVAAGLHILLSIHELQYTEKYRTIQAQMGPLRSDYLVEFEKESQEVNTKMEALLTEAKKYSGKEPLNVTQKIDDLVHLVEHVKDMEQERKNDTYFEIKGNLDFVKNHIEK